MADYKKNMIGVVLCGGKSLRMGADKGLLQQQSMTWAELAASKIAGLKLKVVLSVNEQQVDLYCGRFAGLSIIKDDTTLQVYGPLKGILSVHLQYPETDLLVLACDMPAMKTEAIEYLIKTSSGKKEEAFVFKSDQYAEPLCAIYTSDGLKKIYERYKRTELLKHSLHYSLETINTCYLSILAEWKAYFDNYNSPDDLSNLNNVRLKNGQV